MRKPSKSIILNSFTIWVPCNPEKRVVANKNAIKTTPVASPPTKAFGNFFPNTPLMAKPMSGRASMNKRVRSLAMISF